jgi:hypothetical protein
MRRVAAQYNGSAPADALGATVNERGAAAMKHTDRHARTRSSPVMRPRGRMDFIPAAR